MGQKNSYKIYLAGPISGCNEGQKTHWRKDLKKSFGSTFDWRDPTMWNSAWDPGREILEIDACDLVVANMWRESIGTTIGILHARKNGKPVVLIDPNFLDHKILRGLVAPDKPVRSTKEAVERIGALVSALRTTPQVEKKNGSVVDFSKRKFSNSVKGACAAAGVDEELFLYAIQRLSADGIKRAAQGNGPVPTSVIKRVVFDCLVQIENDKAYNGDVRGYAPHVREHWAQREKMKETESELERLEVELEAVRKELDTCRANEKAMWRPTAEAGVAPGVAEVAPSSVEEAVGRAAAEYGEEMVFLDEAFSSARETPFSRPVQALCALRALGDCARERMSMPEGQKLVGVKEWFKTNAARCPGVKYKGFESDLTMAKYGTERTFQHNGKKIEMQRHLALGAGVANAMLRIHFEEDDEKRFVIGHVGRHLTI